MRVGFYLADQNPHRDRTLGITAYTRALLEQLQGRPKLGISALRSRSSLAAPSVMPQSVLPFRTDHSLGRIVADQLHPLCASLEVDVWHYPKGFLPLGLRYRRPVVGTVCDVILQHYADKYPSERSAVAYRYWLLMLKRSIPRFDAILTISEFSKRQILEFAQRHCLKCPPVRVTYLSCDWIPCRNAAKQDFVLHLASTQPHKGTGTLLGFWHEMERRGENDLRLELVGSLSGKDRAAAETLKTVRISRNLPREELRTLLANARALALPSEIEGFGLPALESYAVNTPVVYVNGTAVEEILGTKTPGGFLSDSFDSWRQALEEVLQMDAAAVEAKRQELQQRFSWKQCADQTVETYESVS